MSKRQTFPTNEEAGRLNQRAPDPPTEPDWKTKALSPEVQREIEKLAFGPRLPTVQANRIVDHAEGRPVERQAGTDAAPFARAAGPGPSLVDHAAGLPADRAIGTRNADLLPRPGTLPQPKPMHARTRVQAGGYVFAGINFDRAADEAGFSRGGENSTLLSRFRRFDLVTAINSQLAAASTAPNLETARDNLGCIRRYHRAMTIGLAAITAAIAEVEQALDLEQS